MKTYSPTQISTFETCPRKYRFRYMDRIDTGVETIEAFMGKRVHEVLERLYRDLTLSRLNSLEELLHFYEERWRSLWHDGITIVRDRYREENYFETGKRCITDYYRRYYPFDQDRTIGLELRVKIPLTDGDPRYSMVGVIDRLSYAGDGVYEIHDYKTSTTLPDMAGIDQDRQLPLYQLAVEQMWRDVKEVRLVWHYLAFDKEIRANRTREDLGALKEEVIGLINRIEEEEEFRPVENPTCNWCEYRSLCPLWKHLYKVEGLEKGFGEEEGADLVNRYALLKKRLHEIEEEMKSLEKALLNYARKEGVEIIFGEGYKVRVKVDRVWRFPTKDKDPAGRRELEDWIKGIGRWEEVSYLNATTLDKILKEGRWDREELEGLKRFASPGERVSFYLSRTREE